MITIGYFGDGPWASRALDHLVKRPDLFSVRFITPRFDTQDPELRRHAMKLGVPFMPAAQVNDPAFISAIAAHGCDLFLSMSFNQIFKAPIRAAAPLGFINCHAGALPFYRGCNPLNWVLINDEKALGVTVHHIDDGIDTGDIIARRLVPIANDDTYATLLEKAHGLCAAVLVEALMALASGNAPRIRQDSIHPVGFYCGRRRVGDEWVNWNSGSRAIYNFIRALVPPSPGARTMTQEGEVAILASAEIPGALSYVAQAGVVVGRSPQGVVVKTGDSTLLLTSAARIGASGMPGEAFTPAWRIGTRVGSR